MFPSSSIEDRRSLEMMKAEDKLMEKALQIRGSFAQMQKSRVPRPLPDATEEHPDLATAVKRGVKDSNTLLLDWNSVSAKRIGVCCKVFWDGDNRWFYGRILNYDSIYDKYYVSWF